MNDPILPTSAPSPSVGADNSPEGMTPSGASSPMLPCPSCGGKCNAEQDEWDDDPWQVACTGKEGLYHCGYRGPYGEDEAAAIAAHNAIASAVAERDRAVHSLVSAGYTDTGGAEWRPPLGPSASPLLDTIDALTARVAQLEDAALAVDEAWSESPDHYNRYDMDAAMDRLRAALAATASEKNNGN